MARIVIAVVVICMAAGGGWYVGHSNKAARVAWLEDELERFAESAARQSEQQLERQRQIAALSQKVSDYEREIAAGLTSACPSDPVYDSRLRDILETGR